MAGVAISIILIATGAILDFAVTASTEQHGFNVQTVGVILMIVGAVGVVVSLIAWMLADYGSWRTRRHRTVIDDGRGHVMERQDISQ
jgi:H+/Cl- antiporter ClcA